MTELVHRVNTKAIVVHIRVPRSFGVRMWIGTKLLRLAAMALPVTVEVSDD